MVRMLIIVGLAFCFMVASSGCSSAVGKTPAEKRQYISELHDDVINDMVAKYPAVKKKVNESPGYGVFSNVTINVILLSAGNGYGVIVDNATGNKTYMKMGLGGVGPGLGVKDFRQLIIFNTKEAMDSFVNKGWEFGGHADATAKAGDKGGAVNSAGDITSGMEIYQVTESGLALQATVSAAKYWKDDELN